MAEPWTTDIRDGLWGVREGRGGSWICLCDEGKKGKQHAERIAREHNAHTPLMQAVDGWYTWTEMLVETPPPADIDDVMTELIVLGHAAWRLGSGELELNEYQTVTNSVTNLADGEGENRPGADDVCSP